MNSILLCAHLCTKLHHFPARCAQMCTNVCRTARNRIYHAEFFMHMCAQMCAQMCTMFAQVCISVHKYATMCTNMHKCAHVRMHMCFGRIRYYLYSRAILFFGSFLLHQGRFPPYGSKISESCSAVSSVTERHPTTYVYTCLHNTAPPA